MNNKLTLLIIILLTSFTQHAYSKIYKWVDENGKTQFSDQKPPEGQISETIKLKINSIKNPHLSKHTLNSSSNVVIYSASWCGVCIVAKRYFKKNNIPYKEYDIEKSNKGRNDYKHLRGRGVPIILIGKQRMDGFDVSTFEKMYQG